MVKNVSLRLLVAACLLSTAAAAEFPAEARLFHSGEAGYARYRIPALLAVPDGSLLAFCEGRKEGGGLTGDIDLILRRSLDDGATWGPIELVMDDANNTLGNPCPVLDESTGTIWLAYTRSLGSDVEAKIVAGTSQQRTGVLVTHSVDGGKSWAQPTDLTAALRKDQWAWYGTGPGVGIQLRDGRLLIPCYHTVLPSEEFPQGDYQSHMIFSDDHGRSWQLGETVGANTSECQVLQRRDGTIYVNARTVRNTRLRTVGDSANRGTAWSEPRLASRLYDPPCQGSLLSLSSDKPVWLFANPSGPARHNLTIHVSRDEGGSWAFGRQISTGNNQYSSMALTANGEIGCLFESWRDGNYQILFTRFSHQWLLRTGPRPRRPADLPDVDVKSVRKIVGDGEDHNAFTDLCRFQGRIYLTFRKSPIGHGVYDESQIVIMASEDDGENWSTVHRFEVDGRDTRDPHFLVFAGKLFVYSGTWDANPVVKHRFEVNDHLGYAVYSEDGSTWSKPRLLEGTHGHYIWRAATDGERVYLCGRRKRGFARTDTRPQRDRLMECALLSSDDGLIFRYQGMIQGDYGNETAFLLEPDGSILGIARSGGGRPAQVVRAKPPFREFTRVDLDRTVGGPLLKSWNGHHLVGGRGSVDGRSACVLYWLADDVLHRLAVLPSGGDTSYPGFVQLDERRALVSYYSSHEGYPAKPGREAPSSIFIAKLELK